jgi:methionyl aminopeptidase
MHKATIKTSDELKIMEEGGSKLSYIKHELEKAVVEGNNAAEVDKLADDLIKKSGGESAFKKVPKYSWSTCINVNAGIVHGIPHKTIFFKKGDLVSVDVGLYYKGFYTDTSTSVAISPSAETEKFFNAGRVAFNAAVKVVRDGAYVYDISEKIEEAVTLYGYNPVEDLTGHGVGRQLHEEPYIPCFVYQKREKTPQLKAGMAIAIEVMYAAGSPELAREKDGWTLSMADGKISGLFEETVIVTQKGCKIITG